MLLCQIKHKISKCIVFVTDLKQILTSCVKCKPHTLLKQTVPIVDWISSYNWKTDLTSDLISGMTVAIMHIPQGLCSFEIN